MNISHLYKAYKIKIGKANFGQVHTLLQVRASQIVSQTTSVAVYCPQNALSLISFNTGYGLGVQI